MGSGEFAVPTIACDLHVGGHYRILMRKPDGSEFDVGSVYREIAPAKNWCSPGCGSTPPTSKR